MAIKFLLGILIFTAIRSQFNECIDIYEFENYDHSILDCFEGLRPLSNKNRNFEIKGKKLTYDDFRNMYRCKYKDVYYGGIPPVSLKEIRYGLNGVNEKEIERLKKEIHASHLLNAAQNPNIVMFYGCIHDLERKKLYLLYENVNSDLSHYDKDLVKQSNAYHQFYDLDAVGQLQIVLDILGGLKTMHEHNILHLDIKPKNILLTKEPVMAKLADFGSVYNLGNQTKFNRKINPITQQMIKMNARTINISINENNFYGTWEFHGNEYFADPTLITEAKPPTDKSDIYSLGMTLFKVLCYSNGLYYPLTDRNRSPIWNDTKYYERRHGYIDTDLKNPKECRFLKKIKQNYDQVSTLFRSTLLSMMNYDPDSRPDVITIIKRVKKMIKLLNFDYNPLKSYHERITEYITKHITSKDFMFFKMRDEYKITKALYGSPALDAYILNLRMCESDPSLCQFSTYDYIKINDEDETYEGFFWSLFSYIRSFFTSMSAKLTKPTTVVI